MDTNYLETVSGPISVSEIGLVLPHEHLFTDLRGPSVIDYARADPDDVIQALLPALTRAYQAGVTALVECSTVGVGRNPAILQAISDQTPIQIIAPTGVYREAYVPAEMLDYSAERMAELWVEELENGIEGTSTKAGFIKIAISDDGVRPIEVKTLTAAASASQKTGAVVASHTISGEIFLQEWEVLKNTELDPGRFIWVHANLEEDHTYHLEAARIGVYIEFDGVGAPWQPQEKMADAILHLIRSGHTDKILLSHDAGWYQPGNPNGEPEGGYRGYTDLSEKFIPLLIALGVTDSEILQITQHNPISAFGLGN